MKYYFAPLEGITGYLYRNTHHRFFPEVDAYFAPFIAASSSTDKKRKELRDVMPENNEALTLVPQLLANNSALFLDYQEALADLGYTQVNLNLGCPSRTVVAKRRGSGFLGDLDELHRFLDEVFSKRKIEISVKTRLGLQDADGFADLMEIYNEYPICELTIHPRTQKDFYQGRPDMDLFRLGYEVSKNPVCYNGDLCTVEEVRQIEAAFPELSGIMIGRGLLKNPGLIGELKGEPPATIQQIRAFHDALQIGYTELFSGDKPVLFKMKEFWVYLGEGYPQQERILKKIKKCQQLADYEGLAREMFVGISQKDGR